VAECSAAEVAGSTISERGVRAGGADDTSPLDDGADDTSPLGEGSMRDGQNNASPTPAAVAQRTNL